MASEKADSFTLNIEGVRELIESGLNKQPLNQGSIEGIVGDKIDKFKLNMKDQDLLDLRKDWESNNASYDAKILDRAKKNKQYLFGLQKADKTQDNMPVASNVLFEALYTYIPQAIAKNPEPVVYSDNSPEGKKASSDLKTQLQYHAVELELQRKLAVMLTHNQVYFIGVMKHGWDEKTKDITSQLRKPKNFILDKDGYVDEFGTFVGAYTGERIESTAGDLIDMYPDDREYIILKTNGKLGTPVIRTEWWTNEYCFTTFEEKVLEKHKNPFFNYPTEVDGEEIKGNNHFAHPLRPYTFLTVTSLQEQPHDATTLLEQNLKNQDRIIKRDEQIDTNLDNGNNSIAISGKSFNQETAHQAARALQDGDPVLVPDGRVEEAIKRIPANDLPGGIIEAQEGAKDALRGVFGVQGLTAQAPTNNTTAHGMVLNQEYDSSRIGGVGGVGGALESVARNIFNWWTQLYYVFYDEKHYAVAMGRGQAVEYVELQLANSERHFIVTVASNSMAPKDELSERQNAISLAEGGWLDPISLFTALDYPDPMETAKKVTMFRINPQMYMQVYFPEEAQQMQGQPAQGAPPGGQVQLAQGQDKGLSANLGAINNPSATSELGQQAPLPRQ